MLGWQQSHQPSNEAFKFMTVYLFQLQAAKFNCEVTHERCFPLDSYTSSNLVAAVINVL